MSIPSDLQALYDAADRFIALANEMAQNDTSGIAGTALRYAAARYSAFEASMMSENLAADKAKMQTLFTDDFAKMMDDNLNAYIRHLAMQSIPSTR